MAFESMQRYRRDWQQGYADGAISRFCALKDAGPAPSRCPRDLTADSRWRLKPLSFHDNLDLSVDRAFEDKERALDQQLQAIGNKALEQPDDVRDGAKNAFAVVPPDLGIRVARCEWHDLKCHLVGMVKRGVKKACRNTRQRMQDNFVASMHEKATTGTIAENQGTLATSVLSTLTRFRPHMMKTVDSLQQRVTIQACFRLPAGE
jgi:hypothetical protein